MGIFEYMFRLKENTTFETVTKSFVAFLNSMEGLQIKYIQTNTACMITIRQPVWAKGRVAATRFVACLRLFRMGGLVLLEVSKEQRKPLETAEGAPSCSLTTRLACFFARRQDRKRMEVIYRHLADLMDEVLDDEDEAGPDFYQ